MTDNIAVKYKVVFKGDIEAGLDISTVKESLAKLFKTTPDRIEKLFSGKKVTLNNNLDEIAAQNYMSEILTTGAVCSIEPMPIQAPNQTNINRDSSTSSGNQVGKSPAIKSSLSKNVEALTAKIAPTLFPKFYVAGWVLSASGMALLFCLYIFIILFTASTLFDHAVDNISFIDDFPIILGLLAYILPIIIGLFFLTAMIKPFFAPPVLKKFSIPLSRKKEPALFIFVEKLCRSIGPKLPANIEIDFTSNATASYRYGIISFLEDDLTLTIGLPAASDMTIEEFAGLLAHEFAHFTEKMTTRLYYIITNVNYWFSHVVFEQDLIDSKLTIWEETASSIFIRVPISFLKSFIWLTRKICTALLLLGHFISRYYVRQMEFEADHYASRLVGSEAFESAIYKTHIASKAMKDSFLHLKKLKNRNDTSLPDNFIELISLLRKDLTEEEISNIKTNTAFTKTGMFDSHPTDAERIEKVKSTRTKGMFQSGQPASSLFSSFDEMVKTASVRFYRESLRLKFDQNSLIPTNDFFMIPEQSVDIGKPESRFS